MRDPFVRGVAQSQFAVRHSSVTTAPSLPSGARAAHDYTDITKLFQDTAGTTPVTTAGQSIARVTDITGNGNHNTQATLVARPVFGSGAVFNGVNKFLESPAVTWGSDEITAMFAVRIDGTVRGILAEFSPSASSNNGSWMIQTPGGSPGALLTRIRGTSYSDAGNIGGTFVTSQAAIVTLTGKIGADFHEQYVNGVLTAATSADAGNGNFGTYAIYTGARGNASLPFSGVLYADAIWRRVLTADERDAARAWLNARMPA